MNRPTSTPVTVTAVYARYSSDLQNDRSIEDQYQACRTGIRPGEEIRHFFEDRAKSGAFIRTRPGINELLALVEARGCDVILTESLDRLSRSLQDIAYIYSIASFHDVRIRTLMEGEISEINIGFNGTMNAVQLQQTRERTRRGQIGNIRAGKSAGGLAYGYRVRHLNDAGEHEPGLREIDSDQALVVRKIFTLYAAGESVMRIARHLNAAGIPSPRGGKWTATTLAGHYGRGDGILQNAIYVGRLVWGRCPEGKNPKTAQRQVRPQDPDQWIIEDAPHLRIIDDALWEAVQDRRSRSYRKIKGHRSLTKIAGIFRCHACNGAMVRLNKLYIMCGAAKRYGSCGNEAQLPVRRLIPALLIELRDGLDGIWSDWAAQLEDQRLENIMRADEIQEQISTEQAVIVRLVESLGQGLCGASSVQTRIMAGEQKLRALQEEADSISDLPVLDAKVRRALRQALTKAQSWNQQNELITACLAEVTIQRREDGSFRFTGIKPRFEGFEPG